MSAAYVEHLTLAEQHARYMAARSRMEGAKRKLIAPAVVIAAAKPPIEIEQPVRVARSVEFSYSPDERWSLADLLALFCTTTGYSAEDIKGASRLQHLVQARHAFFWIAQRFGRASGLIGRNAPPSLPQLGRFVGERDHTTALHAVRKVKTWLGPDPAIPATPQDCINRLISTGFMRAAK